MTTIGVIGAGQLGQMLGLAGKSFGLDFLFLDPADDPPAASTGRVLKYPFDSEKGLAELAAGSDLVTYEFENVPVSAIRKLAAHTTVYPPPAALEQAQDRLLEKQLFLSLGIPVPDFAAIGNVADLEQACRTLGLPLVLKTRRLGYDGKGQRVLRDRKRAAEAFDELGGRDLIAERLVPFDSEVSAIGARNPGGEVALYPLTRNEHKDGILSVSRAPAESDLQDLAADYLMRLLTRLEYVGVLALELFVVDDELLANEYAPRVHNSGHWTIEGAETSQFENHLRAILGMPPGSTCTVGTAGMLNLIGAMPPDRTPFEAPGRYLHDYHKAPRPGRKLGHVTVVAADANERDSTLQELAKYLNS